MSSTSLPDIQSSNTPTLYEVRVRGAFDQTWSDLAENATLQTVQEGSEVVTVIRAMMRDQAELAGLLDSLFSLNATVLSVTVVETA
jgi:hypothetical protein